MLVAVLRSGQSDTGSSGAQASRTDVGPERADDEPAEAGEIVAEAAGESDAEGADPSDADPPGADPADAERAGDDLEADADRAEGAGTGGGEEHAERDDGVDRDGAVQAETDPAEGERATAEVDPARTGDSRPEAPSGGEADRTPAAGNDSRGRSQTRGTAERAKGRPARRGAQRRHGDDAPDRAAPRRVPAARRASEPVERPSRRRWWRRTEPQVVETQAAAVPEQRGPQTVAELVAQRAEESAERDAGESPGHQ
jgi:hypothetical protein